MVSECPRYLREVNLTGRIPSIHIVTDRDAFYCRKEISMWFFPLIHSAPQCADFEWALFRGVSSDRLDTILISGIDVTPTDAPIYANDLDKALEYGGQIGSCSF
jgi:hypothetical protein